MIISDILSLILFFKYCIKMRLIFTTKMFRIPLNFTPEYGWEEGCIWELGREEASPQSNSWDGPRAPEKILPFPGGRERSRNTQRRDGDRPQAGAVKRDARTGRGRGPRAPQDPEGQEGGGTGASPLALTTGSRDPPAPTRARLAPASDPVVARSLLGVGSRCP